MHHFSFSYVAPSPSFLIHFPICLQVPTEFQGLYEKHKALFKKEVNGALSSFGLVVEQMQSNRMALLLKDVSAAIATKEAAPEDPIDLTFDVPTDGGGAPTEPLATPQADVQMGEHGRARSDEEEPTKDDVAGDVADRKSVV